MRAAKLTGERKPVTALFADVVGSTALAEPMDPEDWTAIMNEAFDLMSQAVFRYEGTIAQLQGDAMLAFFGAPVAHEDDPERAVRAALDMVAAIDGVRAPAQGRRTASTSGSAPGSTRGPVVVGNVGSRPALRVHGAGRRGERRGADADRRRARDGPRSPRGTHRFVADAFDVEDLGEHRRSRARPSPSTPTASSGRKAAPARRRGLERRRPREPDGRA